MLPASNARTEGPVNFIYQGETFQTYYKLFGTLDIRTHIPLIVLHGGPGLTHDYLVAFSDLSSKYSIPVLLYDQLGNGRSTHLKHKPPGFFSIDLFIDELINLITYFSIQDAFDLVGHSWGGVLGAEFAVRRQPAGMKHLILSNSLASSHLRNESTKQLRQTLPSEVQEGLKLGMQAPDKFWAALQAFHAVYGCTVKPFPEEYMYSMQQVFGPDGDPTVASAHILKDWSIVDRLHRIHVPTLLINGRKDISQDFVMQPFFDRIQKVKWFSFESSSHTPFLEERERYMRLLAEFLNSKN